MDEIHIKDIKGDIICRVYKMNDDDRPRTKFDFSQMKEETKRRHPEITKDINKHGTQMITRGTREQKIEDFIDKYDLHGPFE